MHNVPDEACFHVSGTVNHHNKHVWGSGIRDPTFELERNSLKVNVWCDVAHIASSALSFSVNGQSQPSFTWTCWKTEFPQIKGLQPKTILQHDGAPSHWDVIVHSALVKHFLG
ncbi:hypothetical protein PR048_003310 [Dryococelus australis]|uniref:Uncharacterized protein n=1 Tax=Dryococelus australis TaxID=614101 RepID=A0ABQ9IN78_9NEOP|nr:hypothetical protein PR048_003310 [Dryococelus australis]